MGAQQQAFGHVIAPQFQRLAKDRYLQSSPKEMGRRRESVGTGADDHGIILRNRPRP